LDRVRRDLKMSGEARNIDYASSRISPVSLSNSKNYENYLEPTQD